MSITAEKIEQIARIIEPWAFDPSADGYDQARALADEKGILRAEALDKAQSILSLLQQGEPEGALRKAYNKIEQHMLDYTHETHSYDASTNAWECSNGEVVAYVEGLDKALEIIKPLLSASPLPPAPGAEKQNRFDADAEAQRIASLPMEDRICEIIGLLKAPPSRQAALEEVEAAERDLISFYDNPKVIGYRNPESLRRWLEAKMRPAFARVRSALATTPPAEGETK